MKRGCFALMRLLVLEPSTRTLGKLLGVTSHYKRSILAPMSEARFLNVEHRVANLENESVRDGNAIERLKKEDAVLENDISTLLLLLENFFVWPSSAPRYGDAQNAAFDKIRQLLKEIRHRYPLENPA